MVDTAQRFEDKGHGLLCPSCKTDLLMSERLGVEIDYCPKCRGVWLDRGELDKIIEKSVMDENGATRVRPAPPQERPAYRDENRGYGGGHGGGGHRGGHGRRESFLGRLFD